MNTPLHAGAIYLTKVKALLSAGQADEALRVITDLLLTHQHDPEAHYLHGQCLRATGAHASAIAALTLADKHAPNREDIGCLLADSLRRTSQYDDARAVLTQLAITHRRSAAIEFQIAQLDEAEQKLPDAITHYRRTLALAPQFTAGWLNLAALLGEQGDSQGALAASRRALALAPNLSAALINVGSALASLKRFDEALDVFKQALLQAPNDSLLRLDVASCQFAGGDTQGTLQTLTPILALEPPILAAHSLRLLTLSHLSNDPNELDHAHRHFSHVAGAATPTPWRAPPRLDKTTDSTLRLGIVSSDFHRHSVWYFLAPLLDGFADHGVSLCCYHTDRRMDDVTAEWRRRAKHWVEASKLDDESLAAQITAHAPDVLLSIGGHTTHSRPSLFTRRLAPLQVGFLGYPGPTGIANIDVRLTDALADPPNDQSSMDRERPVRLAPSYFCYRPMHSVSARLTTNPLSNKVRFGSFNTVQKLTPATLTLWAQLLHMIPEATLTLKSDGLHGSMGKTLRAHFAASGIHQDRIITCDWVNTREAHLAMYREIDIALDTFPYNGATTTCEALWMGVPVVSLSGATPASRMGYSILTAADCAQWVAHSPKDWLTIAAGLTSDLGALRASRDHLRERMAASPLMDEHAYVTQWVSLLREQLRFSEALASTTTAQP